MSKESETIQTGEKSNLWRIEVDPYDTEDVMNKSIHIRETSDDEMDSTGYIIIQGGLPIA